MKGEILITSIDKLDEFDGLEKMNIVATIDARLKIKPYGILHIHFPDGKSIRMNIDNEEIELIDVGKSI